MIIEHIEFTDVITLKSSPIDQCNWCGAEATGRYITDADGYAILFTCEGCDPRNRVE